MRGRVLLAGGLLAAMTALSASGCAAFTGARPAPPGTEAACTGNAYQAIRAHERLAGAPAACRGLSVDQISVAASMAIRIASGSGSKSESRRRAAAAEVYVSALIPGPVPPVPPVPAGPPGGGVSGGTTGSRLGFSELIAQAAALLTWAATAASGGWVLAGWFRAGGSLTGLRRRTDTTAPPAVTLGHVGLGLLGLVLWGLFMITGLAALAWVSVGVLALVAGLGMGVLVLGLPNPRSSRPAGARAVPGRPVLRGRGTPAATAPERAVPPARRVAGRQPVGVIVAHGLFAIAALLMVALAAIGAG